MLTKEDILAIAELMDEKLRTERQAVSEMMDKKLKPINEDLSGVKQDLSGVKEDLSGVKQDLSGVKQDLTGVKQDLSGVKEDLAGVKQDLSRMDHRLAEVETRLGEVGEVASGAKILIETEIDRAIKVLGEGHLGILDGMKDLVTQEQHEDVSVRVFALEEGFKKHSQQIEELQQKTG